MRSGKSFAAHLTGIYAALEVEDGLALNQMVQKWLSTNPKIDKPVWIPKHLEPDRIKFYRKYNSSYATLRLSKETRQQPNG